jgi:hypothetical protein
VIITVSRIETLRNSVWGNPRFKLHAEDGNYTTMSDAAFCVGLTDGWDSTHDKYGRLAKVELTRAGRIRHLTWLVNCHDVDRVRAVVERLRDERAGRLSDESLLERFRKRIDELTETVASHRAQTGCTEFH